MLKTFFSSNSDDLMINDLRVAIFNLLFAKNHDGEFMIKVTNKDLSDKLDKIGVKNIFSQNENTYDIVAETTSKLIKRGLLEKKDGNNFYFTPDTKERLTFKDAILGEIIIDPEKFKNTLLIKDNIPTDDFLFIEDCYNNQTTHIIRNEGDRKLIELQHIINHALKRTTPGSALIPPLKKDNTSLSSLLNDGFSGINIFNYIATIGRTEFKMVCSTTRKIEDTFSVSSLANINPEFDKEHLKWMDTNCKEN